MKLPRVLFVTGKGGTGKSTVAAALAIALSGRRPTTLADLDGRLSAAALLGAIPDNSAAVKVTDSLDVIALAASAELEAFIELVRPYGIRELARTGRIALVRSVRSEQEPSESDPDLAPAASVIGHSSL